MNAADALHVVAFNGMPRHWHARCRRASRACAVAPLAALRLVLSTHVQTGRITHARPMAVAAFDGGATARCAAPPVRRSPKRRAGAAAKATAEGKTKGGGTPPPAKAVCTWGRHGTLRLRRRAASGARGAPGQRKPRASHARARHNLSGARP